MCSCQLKHLCWTKLNAISLYSYLPCSVASWLWVTSEFVSALMDTIQLVQSLRSFLPPPHIAVSSWKNEDKHRWVALLTTICFILVGHMCLMGSRHTPHNSGCRSGGSFGHIPCRWLPISSAAVLIIIAQHMGSPRSQLILKRTTVMGKFLIWLIPMLILILIQKSPDWSVTNITISTTSWRLVTTRIKDRMRCTKILNTEYSATAEHSFLIKH